MLATLKLKQSFENERIQILFYQATGTPHLITSSLHLHNLILQRSTFSAGARSQKVHTH